jgi:hypothetical protein
MKSLIIPRYLAYVSSGVVPAIVAIFFVQHYFGASIFSFIPVWSDEIEYWHEILSFSHNGFSIGYYTIEENLPPLSSVTHFGTHGPFFPMLYGSIAKITGWLPYSGPLFNLFFLSIAITIFLSLIRANLYSVLLTTITFVSFWPIQLYLPSTMQEPLHFAIAILLAGLFHRYMTDEGRPRWLLVTIPVMLTMVSLVKPTWSVLFIPYLFITFRANLQKSKRTLLITGTVILGTFLFAYKLYSAPFPSSFVSSFLIVLSSSPTEAFKYFVNHLASNLAVYLSLQNTFVTEYLLRIQFIAAAIFGIIIYFRFQKSDNHQLESVLHISNLLIPFALIIAFYDVGDWRDYRILAPHVLFSLALFLAQKKMLPCMTMLAISILTIPSFSEIYWKFHQDHFQNEMQKLQLNRANLSALLHYRKDVSPWGNSLLMDVKLIQPFLVNLPAGFGINTVMDWNRIQYPLKSEYVLIQQEIYSQISNKVRFRPIVSSDNRTLYLNLDSPGLNRL